MASASAGPSITKLEFSTRKSVPTPGSIWTTLRPDAREKVRSELILPPLALTSSTLVTARSGITPAAPPGPLSSPRRIEKSTPPVTPAKFGPSMRVVGSASPGPTKMPVFVTGSKVFGNWFGSLKKEFWVPMSQSPMDWVHSMPRSA